MHPIEESIQRSRRDFLTTAAGGIGGLALTALMNRESNAKNSTVSPQVHER